VVARDGDEALRFFRRDEFMAVVTDVMMPHMSGIDLANRVSVIDPDVPVIFISGYYDPVTEDDDSVFDSSVVLAIQKPFDLDSLLRALCFAAAFGTPTNLRRKLGLITDDPKGFLRRIESIASIVGHIIQTVDHANDVGHSLLRHKAKRIADDVLRRIVPGGDVVQYLETAATQLHTLLRLWYVVRPYRDVSLGEHVRNMVEDYGKANKRVVISLDCGLEDAPPLVAIQSVALLVAAEFVDNAIDAVGHKGLVSIEVCWERSNQQLRIEVTDDGPGIPDEVVSNLFRSGRSTKGVGRGLGLGLVKQACEAFRGTTRYLRDDARTTLIATLRLPPEGPSQGVKKTAQQNRRRTRRVTQIITDARTLKTET
jgi:signal transduction histidine kinase